MSFASLRADAIAGLVVGIIALPLSIALAVAVGVPPIAGLYTAVFAGALASIFGGSRYNITGPTAALVPILSHTVLRHGARGLAMAGFLAGITLLLMSALRFGRLIRYMPGLVVVGFTAGIAISIAFGQANNLLGVEGTNARLEFFHQRAWDTAAHLTTVGPATPAVAVLALAILIAWPRIPRVRRVPAALIAVAGVTAITWGLGIDTPTVASHYGELPRELPRPSIAFFNLHLAWEVLPAALSIAVLGAIESLLSAVVADGMSASPLRHDPDRELLGQGIANLVSPLMGGMPATAAIARTAAGIRSDGATRATGVFHALTVLAATLLLGSVAGHIPLAVLAAVLLAVAWNIAEVPEIAGLVRRAPREDLAVLAATIGVTVFLDLTWAIALGVFASTVLLLRRLISLPAAQELLPDESGRIQQVSPELSALIQARPDIAFFTAQGLLSFHSAAAFEYELQGQGRNPMILRMKDVHHVDSTGLITLDGIVEHRQHTGGRIVLTAIQPSVYPALDRFGIIRRLGPENVFEHTRDAIASIDAPHGHETHPAPDGGHQHPA